jgi:DNA-3-methyladenine glycosylase II
MTALGTLQPRPPYNFPLMLDVLRRYATPPTDHAVGDAFRRVLRIGGALALVEVRQAGQGALSVDLLAQSGPVEEEAALAALQHILAVDDDRAAFLDVAREHVDLWQVVEPLAGLPDQRAASVFEGLTQAIIEQQILWTAALRAQQWLGTWAGEGLTFDGKTYYAPPTASQIAAATVNDLKPLKITHTRIGRLIAVARAIVSGDLDLEGIGGLEPEAAYRALLAIHGVGHWTAAVTLSRATGRHDHLTPGDVALQAAVGRYFTVDGGRGSADDVRAIFAPLGAWAGEAAHYVMSQYVLDAYPAVG